MGIIYRVSKFIIWVFLKLLFGIKAYGRENVPLKGGVIIASNHISYLDPPAVGCVCPRNAVFIARNNLFDNPLLGWWMRNVGVLAIKRNSADFSALRQAMKYVNQGRALILFPEGTRSIDGKLGKANPGIGFLAAKLKVPVIPAYIKGTDKAMPKGAKFLKRARITVYYGKPVYINPAMDYSDVTELIMDGIRKLGENS